MQQDFPREENFTTSGGKIFHTKVGTKHVYIKINV